MASVIFYGAGRNACENWERWVKQGLEPVCFVDADIKKQHTFFEKWEILPLLEAVGRYPDYIIYCTQIAANLGAVQRYLLGAGIPAEKIRFCDDALAQDQCYANTLYPQLCCIYDALQDDLSRTIFWGRVKYSISHSLTGVYQAMLCEDNMRWIQKKQTYANKRYGLSGLWEVLYENYPIQKNKIYLLAFDNEWNEFGWVVERFLEAMPKLGIHIEKCVMPYADAAVAEYKGIPCISEDEFLEQLDENSRIIIGFPGWCLETKDIVDRYENYKDILFPIADTAHPQYIEPDIFPPEANEIFVDVGVYDLQNSIDFVQWAKKGYDKIYAFEPDPQCYQRIQKKISGMEESFRSKIELVNMGLSSSDGVLEFPAEYKGSGIYKEGKTIPVEVVSLDSYLDNRPVTFVKMDVEGAEMDVLQGMRETILRQKPKLAVCIYHKYEDIFVIASYLLDLVPEYKFYLRHYNSNETEAVLFCKV